LNFLNLEYKLLFILILSFLCITQGHAKKTNQDSLLHVYRLEELNIENYDFLIYKKNENPKPTIIFIGGSGFLPFFVNNNFNGFPFNIYQFGDAFNFVIMSKPGIPISADSNSNKYINQTFNKGYYIENSGNVPKDFLTNNNRPYFIKGYGLAIKYLSSQNWVDPAKIFVVGHSQGAKIAAKLAVNNNLISKTVLLSPGSDRFHETIRTIRISQLKGTVSPKRTQQMIDSVYAKHNSLISNSENNIDLYDGGTYFSYASFNYPSLNSILLKIHQPTLIIYGTNSLQDLDCDYIPLFLFQKNKSNILVAPYIGYNHNFFKTEYDNSGKEVNKTFEWNNVFRDVTTWLNLEK